MKNLYDTTLQLRRFCATRRHFKKLMTLINTLLFLIPGVSATAFAASVLTPGDVNMDGEVTANDARTVLRLAASLEDKNKLTKEQAQAADYDQDSVITVSDARYILRVATGLDPFAVRTDEPETVGTNIRNADVKRHFGAYGDGLHDDTKAIQNALDSLKNGGTIFFPAGTYLISSCLVFYSDQTLNFSDGAVLKRKALHKSSEPMELRYLMASYTEDSSPYAGYGGVHNVTINGATFDGNEDIRANSKITLLNFCHCSNITIANCSFRNGSVWHCLEANSSQNVRITNCIFDAQSYTVMRKDHNELIQLDAAKIGLYGPVFFPNGKEMKFVNDETPCMNVEIDNCTFLCSGFAAIGCHSDYPHTDIRIHNNTFSGAPDSRGYIGFTPSVTGVTEYENRFPEESQ